MDKEIIQYVNTLIQYSPVIILGGVVSIAYLASRNSKEASENNKPSLEKEVKTPPKNF